MDMIAGKVTSKAQRKQVGREMELSRGEDWRGEKKKLTLTGQMDI